MKEAKSKFYLDVSFDETDENMYKKMGLVYQELHSILYSIQANDVAVDFPNMRVSPENVIRLISTKERLNTIMSSVGLDDVKDLFEFGDIEQVPKTCTYRIIKRGKRKKKSSALSRLMARAEQRGEPWTEEQIHDYKYKMSLEADMPFLKLFSNSGVTVQSGEAKKRLYKSYFDSTTLRGAPEKETGYFDFFGLSREGATIPYF